MLNKINCLFLLVKVREIYCFCVDLSLLGMGGGVQHPPYQKSALRPSKWPPNDPKFRDFSYFYMTYLKSKKKFFGFSQWFWVFRRGGLRTPPRHLMYIFDPATNRVKSAATLLSTRREQAEMVGITKYKCTVHFGIAKTVFLNSFFRKTQRWEEKNCLC